MILNIIFRSHKLLFWQYIDWIKLVQYIDSLKSRKYKSFTRNFSQERYEQNKSFYISPIEILIVLKNAFKESDIKINEFELGYLIFCLSHQMVLDISFFFIIEIRKIYV